MVDDQKIDVRAETDFAATVAAQGGKSDALLQNLSCLFLQAFGKKKGPDEPIHQIRVSSSGQKTRALGQLLVDERVPCFDKILEGVMG